MEARDYLSTDMNSHRVLNENTGRQYALMSYLTEQIPTPKTLILSAKWFPGRFAIQTGVVSILHRRGMPSSRSRWGLATGQTSQPNLEPTCGSCSSMSRLGTDHPISAHLELNNTSGIGARREQQPGLALGPAASFEQLCQAFHLVYEEYLKCG